jgi:hypothetical protein
MHAHRFGSVCTIILAAAPATQGASYRLVIDSRVETRLVDGATHVTETLTTFDYTWIRRGMQLTLTADRLGVRTTQDGKVTRHEIVSRNGLRRHVRGKWLDAPPAKLDAKTRARIQASYGQPLARLTVDASGKETAREMVAKPAAAEMIASGAVDNARLFHLPFRPGKKGWPAPWRMALGQGVMARGSVACQLIKPGPRDPTHLVRVKFTGRAVGSHTAGDRTTACQCGVRGRAIYDTEARQWLAGRQEIAVTHQLTHNGRELATASGKVTATMAVRPNEIDP